MTARLAKSFQQERRHLLPATIERRIEDLGAADAASVLIAPVETAQPRGRSARSDSREIERLHAALAKVTPEGHPRTARLLASSNRKVAQKVIEEAGEVALAAVKRNERNIVRESADLLYHLTVLWHRAGIAPDKIWAEMHRRAASTGIAEKLPKSTRAPQQSADESAASG